jgi:hypothetical protein
MSSAKRLIPPRPPADFNDIDLDPVPATQAVWYRLAKSAHSSPLFFSRQGVFRFDSPLAKWGVCYLATDIVTGFMEVFSDRIRKGVVDFGDLDNQVVWQITVPPDLSLLELSGPMLAKIRATTQCFVSRYALSQEWGRAFMEHPDELDGVIYTGRQSGTTCLALFGDADPAKGKRHQAALQHRRLGTLTAWEGFYPLMAKTRAKVLNLPPAPPRSRWK